MGEMIPFERYKIILWHEYSDFDGQLHAIEEPRCVSYTVIHGKEYGGESIIINEMMDKLKQALLQSIGG